MSRTLFILNDPPYGTERSYNALRLAGSLSRAAGEEVRTFLIGDAAACAVGVCGTCMDVRGLTDAELVEGARRSTLAELSSWTQWAEKVIVF